jgi:hypothetical protein
MECPIKNHAYETSDFKGKRATRDCIKEECAWWNKEHECCAILMIVPFNYPK